MSLKLVNLTPHPVDVIHRDFVATIVPSGVVARCAVTYVRMGYALIGPYRVPLSCAEYGPVENLPDPQEGGFYIVSHIVASAVRRSSGGGDAPRPDLLVPVEFVKRGGRIVGCRGLARI
jgi:hypothetical protein